VDEVPDPTKAVEYDWVQEQWSQGCPCPAMPPGVMTSFGHELRTSHGKVHLLGRRLHSSGRGIWKVRPDRGREGLRR